VNNSATTGREIIVLRHLASELTNITVHTPTLAPRVTVTVEVTANMRSVTTAKGNTCPTPLTAMFPKKFATKLLKPWKNSKYVRKLKYPS
jgi:hypothetical protein